MQKDKDIDLTNKHVVVKFSAEWCQPCKQLASTYEKVVSEFSDVKFFSIDIDDCPNIAQEYKVRSLPTIIFIKSGIENSSLRINGLVKIDPLRKAIKDFSK